MPSLQVKPLQLISRSDTRRFHLRVPDLQMSYNDFSMMKGYWSSRTWWRHQTEAFSALLAICAGNSPVTHRGQWRRVLMFSLICACFAGWVDNRKAGDVRCHRIHYDVTTMKSHFILLQTSTFQLVIASDSVNSYGIYQYKSIGFSETQCDLNTEENVSTFHLTLIEDDYTFYVCVLRH